MNADPDNRPTAEEILKIMDFWKDIEDIKYILESNKPNYSKEQLDELRFMKVFFDIMDRIKYDPSTIPVTKHPDAVYTSRILKSTNLPQPRNSNKVTIIISNHHGNYQFIYFKTITNTVFTIISSSSLAKVISIISQFS